MEAESIRPCKDELPRADEFTLPLDHFQLGLLAVLKMKRVIGGPLLNDYRRNRQSVKVDSNVRIAFKIKRELRRELLHRLTGIEILSATLPVRGAVVLVIISMLLTFIAGLIPSGIAARKDPVIALRSE